MNKTITRIIIASSLLLSPLARADALDDLVNHVMVACAADIEQYCSQVTPGGNRLLHCAVAHQDKISGKCEYALYQASQVLEQTTAAISYVAQACQTEITTLCKGVAAGEGRLLACMQANSAEVSQDCKDAVDDTLGEE